MSGTYPASPSFNAINFKINTPTLVTQTNSGKSRRVGMRHSYYSFTVKYSAITRFDYGPIAGFIAQQYGGLESFQIVLPELSYSKVGNQTSTTVTTSAANLAGVDHVAITGVGTGKNLLRAGDFFKFSNHSKVYMCTTTWTTGQPLYFSGSLVQDVPSGTSLVINAVPFTVILENNVQQFDTGVGGITQLSLDMRETW
jgi:hypothetical protein